MKSYDIYGIGNALVDTEYEVADDFIAATGFPKGMMTLIEEDERQQLLGRLATEVSKPPTKTAGGGSAANTVVMATQLGSRTFYSCKVAADAVGDFFVADLEAAGIDTNLTADREPGATGQCISLVTPDAERTMTTCLGITHFLSPGELNPDALRKSRRLYIEGYLVSSPTGFEAALEAQAIAQAAGVPVSLTLSDPAMAEHFKSNYEQLLDKGIDLLFCNLDEARLLTGSEDADDCAQKLTNICRSFTMTLGSDGSLSWDGETLHRLPGIPAKAVDTTGAGDIYAGAFLHVITQGGGFHEAAKLANLSASLLVTRFGARLTQQDTTEMLDTLEKI
ncbi:MAG: adenosine kinase [Pseudomonadales bacterium]